MPSSRRSTRMPTARRYGYRWKWCLRREQNPDGSMSGSLPMSHFSFLVETYETERLKTLSVWSQIPDDRMRFRPDPRARSPLEHMVHQCSSEDIWMRSMLGIVVNRPALPAVESRGAFLEHYAACSAERRARLCTVFAHRLSARVFRS